jgi:hypothetical protein
MLWAIILCHINAWKRFSPTMQVVCLVNNVWLFPLLYRNLLIQWNPICQSFFCFLSYWSPIQKIISSASMLKSFPYTVFPSSSFKFLDITLRSLIHSELIFVQGERLGFRFDLLHLNIQFSHDLLRGSFFSRVFFSTFVQNHLTVDEGVYFWFL